MEINYLFVYGRLREFYADKDNFDIDSLITIPVKTKGSLYDYKSEAVLIEENQDNCVYGNLLTATDIDIMLRHTDSFMDFNDDDYANSKYIRMSKDVEIEIGMTTEILRAWCYVYPSTRKGILEKEAIKISYGDWFKYKEELDKKSGKK